MPNTPSTMNCSQLPWQRYTLLTIFTSLCCWYSYSSISKVLKSRKIKGLLPVWAFFVIVKTDGSFAALTSKAAAYLMLLETMRQVGWDSSLYSIT